MKRTALGPNDLPFWLYRDFCDYLAPVITDVFNSSLKQQSVPLTWKQANIKPAPKELPFKSSNQFRPISLTNIIMRLFERLVYQHELSERCSSFITMDQFAYHKEHNSTMALVQSQHYWLLWLDGDADFVKYSHLTLVKHLIVYHIAFYVIN